MHSRSRLQEILLVLLLTCLSQSSACYSVRYLNKTAVPTQNLPKKYSFIEGQKIKENELRYNTMCEKRNVHPNTSDSETNREETENESFLEPKCEEVLSSLLGVSESSKSKFVDSVKPVAERPYFDDVGPRNVTAVVGQSALLNCRVKHPGDRTVSWMRKRDLHILTSGIHTYTGDARFSVRHPEHSDDWDLRIEYVQKRDAGVYECQVNTEPKINLAILLNVEDTSSLAATHPGPRPKDAQATISGPGEVYVKKGSTISLTCSVNVHSTPPSSVLWYHGPSVVDFDSPRGGISLETEKTEAGTTSKLLVTKALLSDSGNYTCMPSNASPASAIVHVLNGEHPAAMQTSRADLRRQMALLASFSLLVVTAVR